MNYNKNNGMMDIDIENTLQALYYNNRGIFKLIDLQGSLINQKRNDIKSCAIILNSIGQVLPEE